MSINLPRYRFPQWVNGECNCGDCEIPDFESCGQVEEWMDSDITPGTYSYSGSTVPVGWTKVSGGDLTSDGTWISSTDTTVYRTHLIGNTINLTFTGIFAGTPSNPYNPDTQWAFSLKNPLAGYITLIAPVGIDSSDPIYPNQMGALISCDISNLSVAGGVQSIPANIQTDTEYAFQVIKSPTSIVVIFPDAGITYPIQNNLGPMELFLTFYRDLSSPSQVPKVRNITVQVS